MIPPFPTTPAICYNRNANPLPTGDETGLMDQLNHHLPRLAEKITAVVERL